MLIESSKEIEMSASESLNPVINDKYTGNVVALCKHSRDRAQIAIQP